jgi:hypothetical protein
MKTEIADRSLDLQAIADRYGIRLREADESYAVEANMPIETFQNRSYAIGNQIILGQYDNEELRVASFFHELGHIVMKNVSETKFGQEAAAWRRGLMLASIEGVHFSVPTMVWIITQLETYAKPEYL